NGRGAARGHVPGCAVVVEARVSPEGSHDGGQLFPDVRWRRRRSCHVGRTGQAARYQTAGPLCLLRHRGIQARGDGHRSRVRHSQSSEAGWPQDLRYRGNRIERSLRGTVAVGNQGTRARPREDQSQWGRDCSWSSPGHNGRQAHGHPHSRTQTPQSTLRSGHHVCGRRHGRSRHFRESELIQAPWISGKIPTEMPTFYEQFVACERRWPGNVALEIERRDGLESYTYSDLRRMAESIAGWLREQGQQPGSRLAILADNHPRWTATYLGAIAAGCTAVPLDTAFHAEQVAKLLKDSGSSLLFTDSRHLAVAQH